MSNQFKLGEEQLQVVDMITNFIKDKKDKACLYYGAAGTGKSVIINYIVQYCEQNGIQYTLCAPTHKAALVMSRYTNKDAITIHKLLSLSPKLDIFALDFNNLLFQSKGYAQEMPYEGVVICDEASMINDDLYDVLLTKCGEFKNQLIFAMDACQLQPVKQDQLTKIIHTEPRMQLTKIYRQSEDSGLMETLNILRNRPINNFIPSFGLNGSINVTDNMKEFLIEARKHFISAIKNSDILETKILCYTNDRVQAYNQAIHKSLFKDCEYHKGEFLIGCENLEFNKYKFYNSMDYIINSEPIKCMIRIPNFGSLPGWKFSLYDSLEKCSASISILCKEELTSEMIYSLAEKIEDYRQQAVAYSSISKQKARFYWQKYYEMINSFTTPVDLYYDNRLIRKKSFDYGYAITSHKSQGSSFNNIFVDIRNINSCKDEAIRRQLQYVTLSRTRNDVLIYQ